MHDFDKLTSVLYCNLRYMCKIWRKEEEKKKKKKNIVTKTTGWEIELNFQWGFQWLTIIKTKDPKKHFLNGPCATLIPSYNSNMTKVSIVKWFKNWNFIAIGLARNACKTGTFFISFGMPETGLPATKVKFSDHLTIDTLICFYFKVVKELQ